MRIITLHCDYIKFKPLKKAIKNPEEISEERKKEIEVKDPLVVLTAIEKGDNNETIKQLIASVKKTADDIKAKKIVLYPYAHLSSNLSDPDTALEYLTEAEHILAKEGFQVIRAPFGYYKEFELKCKGHPLSELSKEFKAEGTEPLRLREVKEEIKALDEKEETYDNKIKAKGKDSYLILTHDGKEFEVKDYKFTKEDDDFKMLVEKEALKIGLKGGKEPGFIKYANQFQIEWEPMSDKGNMRYGPEGTLMFNLVEEYAENIANSLGIPVYSVKGTNMFNLKEPAVKEHANLFGDRLYSLNIDKNSFVLRYAACHQQFAMIKDWNLSYKNLPFGALENADSYRYEQAGELLLAFRTRRMDMPDLHVFCKNFEESKEWFTKIHDKIYEQVYKIERDYEILFNFSSRAHYENNKEWVLNLLKKQKKNALLHFYPEGINYYWTFNIEYMIIDELKRPREIATVQIDIGNAKRFGIKFKDNNNNEIFPVILHTATIGTIGRYLFSVLDTVVQNELKGKKAELPYWLSPTQARILPVSDKFNEHAIKLAEKLNAQRIRTDVEDRGFSLPKKVSSAEINWVPYIIVLGEKEVQSKKLAVRIRQTGKIENLTEEELVQKLKNVQGDMPWQPIALPVLVSKRPLFR
ncbi:MAG: threonine--tRNA ligase [Nanoarchaeota archaeon]